MKDFKVPADILTNRNGFVMNVTEDDASIGHHTPVTNPYVPFSTGETQRLSAANARLFPNGSSEANGNAGVINKNGEYGPVTYGF